MKVFIDTNVLLSLYHYGKDDLAELEKLLFFIEAGEISLITTDQVLDEFWKNRESKIDQSLRLAKDYLQAKSHTRLVTSHGRYNELREISSNYANVLGEIIEEVTSSVRNKTLGADTLVTNLLSQASQIEVTEDIILRAQRRVLLRKPPGKEDGSIGDAINWEVILDELTNDQEMHIITRDRDYSSLLDEKVLKPYMEDEVQKKNARVFLYKDLNSFFKDHFPDIQVTEDIYVLRNLDALEYSGNFSATHKAINFLTGRLPDFTVDQAERIKRALLSNNQVYWISEDEDVNWFANQFFAIYENIFNDEEKAQFFEYYRREEDGPISLDSIPF